MNQPAMIRTAVCALLMSSSATQAQGISIDAVAGELSLSWLYPPSRIESVCGSDLFAIESPEFETRRVCVRRNAQHGRLEVISQRQLSGIGGSSILLRGPTADDRGLLFWQLPALRRYDPVTETLTDVVVFSNPEPALSSTVYLFDREGDGQQEMLLESFDGLQVRSLVSGAVLSSLPLPWTLSGSIRRIGQFDGDANAELAHFDLQGGLRIYDLGNFQIQGPLLPVGFSVGDVQVADLDGDGIDELAYSAVGGTSQLEVLNFNAAPVRTILTNPGAGPLNAVKPIQWAGDGRAELALLWDNKASIYDPRSQQFLVNLDVVRSFGATTAVHAVDVDGVGGGEDLTWFFGEQLQLWRNGALPVAVQNRMYSFAALDAPRDSGAADLLTVEHRSPSPGFAGLESSFTRRDGTSLATLGQQVLTGVFSTLSYFGDVHPNPGRERLELREFSMRVHNAQGQLLWEAVLPFEQGNDFRAVALSPLPCTSSPCASVLAIENANHTGTTGSRLALYDGASGTRVWTGPADGALGTPYVAVAYGDITGDGQPDLLSLKSEFSQGDASVVARDGLTRQVLWQRSLPLGTGIHDIEIAAGTPARIGLLIEPQGGRVIELLDPTTGQSQRSRTLSNEVRWLQPLPYEDGGAGWILLGESNRVQVLDADLRGGRRSIPLSNIREASSNQPGIAYLASNLSLYKLRIPADTLFIGDFEGK